MFHRSESHNANIQGVAIQGIYGEDYSRTPLGPKADQIDLSTSGMGGR
jgi:hypothetical protein